MDVLANLICDTKILELIVKGRRLSADMDQIDIDIEGLPFRPHRGPLGSTNKSPTLMNDGPDI